MASDDGALQQPDGCFPRINGGMIQTQAYHGMIVSLVGKVIAPDTIQAADGTNVHVMTDQLAEGSLMVNPDLVVEIMGMVIDQTTITAFVLRELSSDMDLNLYNKLVVMMQQPKFTQYFDSGMVMGPTN
mmetsp:Transcript_5388/g.8505  ORF Transcript_5388/g.8505 Transcript_5388/m.8505 type:complete len:129 (+) Transcript_5388:93-479(+)|eukprot:CAMPEP_0178736138 /NCGR_PEP_ID=MMETSP0744-20121128/2272_1 /TAXON_ID=913974 /ORGANISM="Nitzschia punctata, Strain CCMP561" /LENGTH=128 /DNA_ID=CAMNT_0020388575 /DNA_START=21 /DNA_END=407 /DNA_ORIENTATION=+